MYVFVRGGGVGMERDVPRLCYRQPAAMGNSIIAGWAAELMVRMG